MGGLGRLPTELPRRAIDYRGKDYTIIRPQDTSDEGRQTDGLGQSLSTIENVDTTSHTELLYFHDRHMSREQTEMGERRVERITSWAYSDVDMKVNDRTDHDGVEWECETIELIPTPQEPSFMESAWINRDV